METLSSTEPFANPWLAVREDTVRLPDGSVGVRTVVTGPDIALVVPLDGDRLHLVEQHRHPVGGRRWELPSGSLDETDVDPAAAAARELREETGLVAATLAPLGVVEMSPSTLDQRCRVFLATGLVAGPSAPDPEEQDLRSAWFTRAEVEQMVLDGRLTDAKSLAAYALLQLRERAASA